MELDTSSGDSGAGEKMGYVLIDGSGFGTPGPCLQKASKEEKSLGDGCLDVPGRKLGSMVCKWVISPTYEWGILGIYPP